MDKWTGSLTGWMTDRWMDQEYIYLISEKLKMKH
jgi:hypothetical protein